MTSPWGALDAATGKKNLYLTEAARDGVNAAFSPHYHDALQALIDAGMDDTTGYFGSCPKNTLAPVLQTAFNSRGKTVTDYLNKQLAETEAFVKTANDAANALQNHENG
jgi:hypothetical protein